MGSTYVWNTGATTQTIVAATSGTYYATATNGFGCTSSDTIQVTSSTFLVPAITITASDTVICAGRLDTFTAIGVNGGTTPIYNWRKNGVGVGSIGNTYITSSLLNGDYITCRIVSSSPCAVPNTVYSDTIHLTVNPTFFPAVTITHLPDTACAGTPITFTANPINGGTLPFYQWKKAGAIVGTGSTYTYSPTVLDSITVDMASSLTCHAPDTVSNTTGYIIYPHLIPVITISKATTADSVAYIGQVFTFNSTVTFGGTAPRFQWYVNRLPVAGATNSTFAPHIYTNDTIVCVVTGNAVCSIPNKDTSNAIRIYASFLDVNDINTSNSSISIFPNPTNGNFTVRGIVGIKANDEILIEVRDLKGSIVYRKFTSSPTGELNESLSLNSQLADGLYLLRVHTDSEDKVTRLIIGK